MTFSLNDTRSLCRSGAVFALSIVFGAVLGHGEHYHIKNADQLRSVVKALAPGDEVILSSGMWSDSELRIEGTGTKDKPILFRAEVPGKTIVTGASRIRISGSFLELSGIKMVNVTGRDEDWLEFRYDSKRSAENCIVRDCSFVEDNDFESKEKENRWIGMFGQHNQLSDCFIQGKKNKGTTLVVWLGEKDQGYHRIANNYFGERPLLGKNGGETIRIGDSTNSMRSANCIIENNLFEHCDGETECISNKSCDNIYRGNTFREVQGTLTLRHGNRCLVEKNIFLGNKRNQTGGIRVIGEDHRILNNYLVGLEGDGFRTAISLLNGIPNSPDNGYLPVQRAVIDGNVIVDCKHSVLLAYNDIKKATVMPTQIVFRNQRIVSRNGRETFEVGERKRLAEILSEIHLEGNQVQTDKLGIPPSQGIEQLDKLSVELPRGLDRKDVGPRW